jgi:hypothetical protein
MDTRCCCCRDEVSVSNPPMSLVLVMHQPKSLQKIPQVVGVTGESRNFYL